MSGLEPWPARAASPEQTSQARVPLLPFTVSFGLRGRRGAADRALPPRAALRPRQSRLGPGAERRCSAASLLRRKQISAPVLQRLFVLQTRKGNDWWLYDVVCRYSNKSLMKHEVHLALSAFLCFHTTLETTAPIFLFQFFVSVFIRYGKCNDLMHLHFL